MTHPPVSTIVKLRALPWYFGLGAGNLVFGLLTVLGPIFPLFLTELGLSFTKIGFVIALIPFFALLSLVLSRWVVRVGPKRVFIAFYGVRKIIIGLLLLAPWILAQFGAQAVFCWVTVIILLFACCRGIAETAFFPWVQEFIPNRVRGKVDAVNAMIAGVAALLVTLGAAWIVKQVAGLAGYSLLIGAGVVIGLLAVGCMAFVPGGKPQPAEPGGTPFWEEMRSAFRDRNFRCYLGGIALYYLGMGFLPFLPIFFKNQIGLSTDKIVILDAMLRIGLLGSSFLWGWSVDRYGGKPAVILGLLIMLIFPLFLVFVPREAGNIMTWLALAYVVLGVGVQGMGGGSSRYFFVQAVPPGNRNSAYYSLNYACISFFGAVGPFGAGRLLDLGSALQIRRWGVSLDAFAILFLGSLGLLSVSVWLLHRLRKDGSVRTGEFVSMFMQGNPLLAVESLLRYRLAQDEGRRIVLTERMGQAKNPLSVDELLEALSDPSFNVRYEAIVSVAHMPPHPRLSRALIDILRRKEPDLSVAAGWALGRIGDRSAIPALREMLVSEYALLRSRSARSLANLGDAASVPLLLQAFGKESHDGIRVAYASALGVFRAAAALDDLLVLLRRLAEEDLRDETALALARMIGGEHHYIRLWRAARADFGTAGAQAAEGLKDKIAELNLARPPIRELFEELVRDLAGQAVEQPALALSRLCDALPAEAWDAHLRQVLRDCAEGLREFKGKRREYFLLAFTALEAGIIGLRRRAGGKLRMKN